MYNETLLFQKLLNVIQISCAGWTLDNAAKVLPTFEGRAALE